MIYLARADGGFFPHLFVWRMSLNAVKEKLGDHHRGFVHRSRTLSRGHRAPECSQSDHCKGTYRLALIISTAVLLGLLTGVKEQGLPSLPHHHPFPPPLATSADSQRGLLFSSRRLLLRDTSLAALNRHTCVTRGYGALSLISLS